MLGVINPTSNMQDGGDIVSCGFMVLSTLALCK